MNEFYLQGPEFSKEQKIAWKIFNEMMDKYCLFKAKCILKDKELYMTGHSRGLVINNINFGWIIDN